MKIRLEHSPAGLQDALGLTTCLLLRLFHLFFSTGTGMKQVEILGEVPSVEAVRGHPSSYFEERMPERDMIAGFFLFFNLVIISVFFPILPCLPQICTVRGEEESQWESVPGIGAFLQQGHRFQMLFTGMVMKLQCLSSIH